MMPNGLAYVSNVLAHCNISYQIVDFNIRLYHKFHFTRLKNRQVKVYSDEGYLLPKDP